jgi:hypothetical protein
MPISFAIDPVVRLVTYRVVGPSSADDTLRFLSDVSSHQDYRTGFSFLGDRRDSQSVPDVAYVRAVADELDVRRHLFGPCRWAVLVSSQVAYGMARMWGLMNDRSGIEVFPFYEPGDALNWLGLEEGYQPRLISQPVLTAK